MFYSVGELNGQPLEAARTAEGDRVRDCEHVHERFDTTHQGLFQDRTLRPDQLILHASKASSAIAVFAVSAHAAAATARTWVCNFSGSRGLRLSVPHCAKSSTEAATFRIAVKPR